MAINAENFLRALDEIEAARGINKEHVLETLKEVLEKGLRRQIGFEDANVKCEISLEKGTIDLYQIFTVVDDVEDDVLEIHIDDAKKSNPDIKLGDDYYLPCDPDELKKSTAMAVKSMLKQKFAEAEKSALYEQFKDKIGTMITGKVEKVDEYRGLTVNVGKTSVFLPKSSMIGDETFLQGENIKLFVQGVESGNKGAHILVSRSNEGFLKALFHEELSEIEDGTIEIKAIARRAGERSKVAVYSNDPNLDPAGACIGQNGSKIQRVVSQLGNGKVSEKIDIIAWSENKALFVMEALKPAQVLGISLTEDGKSATVVVSNDSFLTAIGRKGVNVNLAVRLTKTHIDIKTEDDAIEEQLAYQTLEDIQAEEIALKAERIREAQIAALAAQNTQEVLPGLPENYVAPLDRKYEEEADEEVEEALYRESEKEEIVTEIEVSSKEEVVEEVKNEEVVEEIEKVQVKTTTSIDDLEKSLEDSKNKSKSKSNFKRKKNNKKEETEETPVVIKTSDPSTYMSIYTDEELAEMEEEENEEYYDDEDIDYDEYDSYYDDDNN